MRGLWVQRAIYVRNPQIDGFYALRIYWRICVFAAGAAPTGANHEPRRLASRRSAAGMSRRRFDLKVGWDISWPSFDILFSDDLRQTSPAIPTCGSRQAPCHENRLRGTRKHTKIGDVSLPNVRKRKCTSQKIRVCSCAAEAAFVSGARGGDEVVMRRGARGETTCPP
jgi:hypothetical protein